MYLKVYTNIFHKELDDFLKSNKYDSANLKKTDKLYKDIFKIIQEVALKKSKVLREHSMLREKIIDLVFIPCKYEILQGLKKYIEEHDIINLEGYVQFRMNEYLDMIDIIAYMIIKNGNMGWIYE